MITLDKQLNSKPEIIKGDKYLDDKGILKYFNTLDLSPVKRLYTSKPSSINIIKAWQGHQKECKWFYVTYGEFKVVLVKPDNWINPKIDLEYEEFKMKYANNQILFVPAGFLTGFQALVADSELMIFSDKLLGDSLNDDYRFDKDLFYNWYK